MRFTQQQVADQEVKKFGLVLAVLRFPWLDRPEGFRDLDFGFDSSKRYPVNGLSSPTSMKEQVGLREIDEPLVFHDAGNEASAKSVVFGE